MKRLQRMFNALRRYKTAQLTWGYLVFSLVLSLYFVYIGDSTWLFIYTLPFIMGALIMGYVSYRVFMRTRHIFVDFYQNEGAKIDGVVADVGKPYRRGALYHPTMIEDIVDGKDPYHVYIGFLTKKNIPSYIYKRMMKYAALGEQVFWGTLLEMIKGGLIVAEPYDDDIVMYVRKCGGVSLVFDEVCDVLKKAAVRETISIDYNRDDFQYALTISTLIKYLSEPDIQAAIDRQSKAFTRIQHIGLIMFTHIITEFKPPYPFDRYPPFNLPRHIMLAYDKYKSTYALSFFMSTLAWSIPYFGLTYFAFLAAIVSFSVAYLYVPSSIYHPSVPWYNRYRVWNYMRQKYHNKFPHKVKMIDAIAYTSVSSQEANAFFMGVYLGLIHIGV